MEKKEIITEMLIDIFDKINIETPSNFDDILNFMVNDITIDKEKITNEDIAFSFKKWIESCIC